MNARPRVALIGCGRIGQVHLRTLLGHPEVAEFAILVDANPAALASTADAYRLAKTDTDVAAIFDDPSIDAVILASSTETHAPYIIEAARTGKAVVATFPVRPGDDIMMVTDAGRLIRVPGDQVRVTGRSGLKLTVAPLTEAQTAGEEPQRGQHGQQDQRQGEQP